MLYWVLIKINVLRVNVARWGKKGKNYGLIFVDVMDANLSKLIREIEVPGQFKK